MDLTGRRYDDALRMASDAGVRLTGAEVTYPRFLKADKVGPLRVVAQHDDKEGIFLVLAHELSTGEGE